MEYLFGTRQYNGEERHTLRTKGKDNNIDKFVPGVYYSHTDHYFDMSVTDNFKIDHLLQTSIDFEGNTYVWYILSEYSRYIDRTPEVKTQLETNKSIASITFVKLAEEQQLDDITASEHPELFIEWSGRGVKYEVNQLRTYNGQLYRCISAHTSQDNWTPDTAVSLWKATSDPTEEWPEWSQPIGAFDAYQSGDKVSYKGEHYSSTIDNNVWAPDIYGWQKEE